MEDNQNSLVASLEDATEDLGKMNIQLESFDFIRFTIVDINGIPRAKLVPAKTARKYMEEGIRMYAGITGVGCDSQLFLPQELADMQFGNACMMADRSTLHPVSWVNDESYKVGQVFVEPSASAPPAIIETTPRYVARKQIKRLGDLGYNILSGIEWEYILCDKETGRLLYEKHRDFHSTLLQTEFHSWFCDVGKKLEEAGVTIQTMQNEYGYSQFEFNSAPEFGIKSADRNVIMKYGIKEMATMRGWEANFMAKIDSEATSSGAHFSFSLWDKNTGANAFYDETGPNKLSPMAQHWIAGFIKHAPALTALCCPTTNCYKRLHEAWVPNHANWDIDNRFAALRVKNFGEKGTFMENRIPSPLSSPYIVMAATLAAGMDGVINKLPCPEPMDKSATVIPYTLEEALQCLKSDEYLSEAIGETFINWFHQIKKEADLKAIDGLTDEKEIYEAECVNYGRTC